MVTHAPEQHRREAIEWAKSLVALPDFMIVDTETTGLKTTSEIVSIGIVNQNGDILLGSLVKPYQPIPTDATQIHGITNAAVASAPTFHEIHSEITRLLRDQVVVIYNLQYDAKRLQYCCSLDRLPAIAPRETHCAMRRYARFCGEWSDFWHDYQWQKLAVACERLGIVVRHAHSAVGDCLMTLELIRHMARN